MGFSKDEAENKGVVRGSKSQARRGDHMSKVPKSFCKYISLGAAAPVFLKIRGLMSAGS